MHSRIWDLCEASHSRWKANNVPTLNKEETEEFKVIVNEFEISDLEKLTYFLGIEFIETKEMLVMHQKQCVVIY